MNKTRIEEIGQLGKIPPQAVELEEVVLGALLLEKDVIDKISNILTTECFYKDAHQKIYNVILSLHSDNKPIDILTVTEELKKQNLLDEVGGSQYIRNLTNKVASGANSEYHSLIIAQKYIQRELIHISHDIQNKAYDDSVDVYDTLSFATNKFNDIDNFISQNSIANHLSIYLDEAFVEAKKREKFAKEGRLVGIPSGLIDLDKIIYGWQNADLIILAARPSMGKTAMLLKFAKSAALVEKKVAIFSLEMKGLKLADRLILSEADIADDKYMSGYLKGSDWFEFEKAQKELEKLPIYIDDKSSVSMRYIKSKSRLLKKQNKCDMILIDYLQLAEMESGKNVNREREVSKASEDAKKIAKDLDIPVILLCQLSREVERRRGAGFKPILSDLKESGAIEANADIVIFIYRPEYYNILEDENSNNLKGIGFLIIAKHRNGAIGEVPFRHNTSLTKIYDFENPKNDEIAPF